jgi:hypothetical protein
MRFFFYSVYQSRVYLKTHSLEHESPTLAGAGFEQVLGLEYHHHKLKHRNISLIPPVNYHVNERDFDIISCCEF